MNILKSQGLSQDDRDIGIVATHMTWLLVFRKV